MFPNFRLSIFFTASLLLALGVEPCDSKKPRGGAGQSDASATGVREAGRPEPTPAKARSLYHGVHPGSADGDEQSAEDLDAYVGAAGKPVAFVYISQELNRKWLDDENDATAFPAEQVSRIRQHGAIPFIRLMTRESSATNEDENFEKLYSYDVLIGAPGVKLSPEDEATKAKFRRRMLAWAKAAGEQTLFVEWGTEANGKWFWWNAFWYADRTCQQRMLAGGRPDDACRKRLLAGTEKFRQSFQGLRKLVNVEGGARNVKWVFHVASWSDPNPHARGQGFDWNGIENYYPGDDCRECVDALGVSAYGPQKLGDGCDASFDSHMDRVLEGKGAAHNDSLRRVGQRKRIFVLEFGHSLISGERGRPDAKCDPAGWAASALKSMFDPDKWFEFDIAGFSWWNEAWVEVDQDSKSVTDMRLQHFDLCDELDDEDEAKKVEKVLPCRCWNADAAGRCYGLRPRRDRLRAAFSETLNTYEKFLRTRPDEALLK